MQNRSAALYIQRLELENYQLKKQSAALEERLKLAQQRYEQSKELEIRKQNFELIMQQTRAIYESRINLIRRQDKREQQRADTYNRELQTQVQALKQQNAQLVQAASYKQAAPHEQDELFTITEETIKTRLHPLSFANRRAILKPRPPTRPFFIDAKSPHLLKLKTQQEVVSEEESMSPLELDAERPQQSSTQRKK